MEFCTDLQISFTVLKHKRNRPTKQKRIPRIIPIIRIGLSYRFERQKHDHQNNLSILDHCNDEFRTFLWKIFIVQWVLFRINSILVFGRMIDNVSLAI